MEIQNKLNQRPTELHKMSLCHQQFRMQVNLIVIVCLAIAMARKSDNWPPQKVVDTFDMAGAGRVCRERIGVNEMLIAAFEEAPTVDQVPDDRELKCYMQCWLAEMGLMRDNDMLWRRILHLMDDLPLSQQQRYFKMGRNCASREQDACEKAFIILSCFRRNSNDDFFIF